ncbi:hypothetical protein [Roseisolibacter agri]|nr:hypothetical protein [Roseisolibacter agri]
MRTLLILLLAGALCAAPTTLDAQRRTAPVAATPPRARPARDAHALQPMARARDGARRRPWIRNALVGAAVGGAVGYGIGHSSCDACDDPAPIYAAAVLGAGLGAAVGLAITLAPQGAQVRWHPRAPARAPAR